jgi:diguanylate cyclase (GGDEF)-like protein
MILQSYNRSEVNSPLKTQRGATPDPVLPGPMDHRQARTSVQTPRSLAAWSLAAWSLAAGVIFGLHLLLSVLIPDQAWITLFGISASYILAALVSRRQARLTRGILSAKWYLLTTAFVVRLGRDIAILFGAYYFHFEPERAWLHSAIGLLYGVPILFVLSSSDDDSEPHAFAWFDGIQLLLIGSLFVFDLFPGVSLNPVASWLAISTGDVARLRDLELLGLILLSAARVYAAAASHMRALYANLIVLLLPSFFVNHLNDYIVEHSTAIHYRETPGHLIFALTDLPPLLFVLLTISGIRLLPIKPASNGRMLVSSIIRLGSPAFFAIAVLLLSIQTMATPPHIGVWASCAGLLIYGTRSAFLQLRYQRTETRLLAAQGELLAVSRKDPLTELYNRRWFDQTLRQEWAHAQRGSQSLALLIIDIDHFKEFNDAAGHKAGDQCLIEVAAALRARLPREGDSISRYGGEEFAVILPSTDSNGARLVAERLRDAVTDLRFIHPKPSRAFVSISIGVASITPTPTSTAFEELFLLADAALYQAKQLGRNRVELA